MADAILRLRVESKEYDAKIKRATDGLLAFEDSCNKAKKSMADADKATVDFVKQIGQMGTVNRTAKGSVNELNKAFVELSAQYNKLTDKEKASPFGQALAKSIDQLKGRVQQGRQELDNINQSLNNTGDSGKKTGSILDNLAGKFGLNTAQLLKLGGSLGLATTALNVAKDAFFASEASLDEWGRVVRSADDVYQGFLTAINTGDISGYLGRIDTIIKAARDAYDALDRLSTFKTISTPGKSAQDAENERMRTMLRTGRYIAPTGQKAVMAEGTVLTEKQLQNIARHLESGEKKSNSYARQEVALANDAIDKMYIEQAQRLGMSKGQFLKGTSSMEAFERNLGLYRKYQEFENAHTTTMSSGGMFGGAAVTHRDNAVNPNAAYKGWGVFKDDGDLFQAIVQQIQQRDQTLTQVYSNLGRSYRSINRAEGVTPYGGGGGGGHRGGGTGSGATAIPKTEYQLNSEQIEALSKEYVNATAERKTAIQGEIKVLQERNTEIQKLMDEAKGKTTEIIPEGSMKALTRELSWLKEEQQKATSTSEWQRLQGMIDATQKKMDDLQGKVAPDMGLFSSKNMSALSSSIKQKLDEAEIGTEVYDSLTNQLSDVTALSNLLGEFLKHGIDMADVDAEAMWQKIFGGEDVATEELQKMLDKLNAYLAENGLDLMQLGSDGSLSGVKSEEKGKSKFEENLDKTNKGLSGLQTVMSGVQQMGLKIPTGLQDAMNIMQGLMSVVQGVSTIISIFSTTAENANTIAVTANTAAVGALTAVMAVNTATSVVPFMRHGGIAHAAHGLVAGHDFSDNTPVMVSSGELILNKAQQGNLASQLNGGGSLENLHLETEIHAEKFRIMLNANSKRRGRGEYVTTRTT